VNVLIINTNQEQVPCSLLPLGACLVASATEAAGHHVQLLDLCGARAPVTAVAAAIQGAHPEVIGLSVRNLDNGVAGAPKSYLPELRTIVEACRQYTKAEIVLGGSAVLPAAAEPLLRSVGCRLAICGEGEHAFPALLAALERGQSAAGIPGVVVIDNESVKITPSHACTELSTLPDANLDRWLDLAYYRRFDAALPVQSKRGCAFRCTYCTYPLLEGAAWRLHPPEAVAEEVAKARATGLRMVDFVDSVFGVPAAHTVACCEAIARGGSGIPLSTMDLSPAGCTPEVVAAMATAGFSAVGISAESGSDAMLRRLGKGFGTDDLRRAARNLRALPAKKLWFFLLGGPGETEATLRETIRFIEGLPATDLVMISYGIRILPGTLLQTELIRDGVLEEYDDLLQPIFYQSPTTSVERVARLLAASVFPMANVVMLHDGGHPLLPVLQRVIAWLGLQPPYWRYVPCWNRLRNFHKDVWPCERWMRS